VSKLGTILPLPQPLPFSKTLAFCSGAVAVLAFAPFSLSWVAPLSLTLLFGLWQSTTPSQAFKLGWWFGLGFMGFGVSWLYISIDQFGGIGLPLAIIITLLFVATIALFFGMAGGLGRWLCGSSKTTNLLLTLPAVWALTEWVRGWFLTGFPWLSMGYSQLDSPLQGAAPIAGIFGVSWLVALTAALMTLICSQLISAPALRPKAIVKPLLGVGAIAMIWLAAHLLDKHHWTSPAGDPIKVTLIQGNIPQELKWEPSQFGSTMRLYTDLTRANWESDLIIWPETAIPAFYHRVKDDLLDPLEAEAQSHNTDLLVGIALQGSEDKSYFNAMVSLGKERDSYRKRHLVPFGEFLPLKWLLSPLIDFLHIPMSDFSAGDDSKTVLNLAGYPAGISICYEDAFGEEIIQALPEAAFLVNASNDAWFGDSLAPHQHLEIARMRALESGRYLLRATNTGISAIIGPKGEIQGLSAAFEKAVLTREITPMQGMTPYASIGNWGIVSAMLILLLVSLFVSRSRQAGG